MQREEQLFLKSGRDKSRWAYFNSIKNSLRNFFI